MENFNSKTVNNQTEKENVKPPIRILTKNDSDNHTNPISTNTTISREEILKLRKERKRIKQDEKKKIREFKKWEQKTSNRSEKIQIITAQAHQKYQNAKEIPPKSYKIKRDTNKDFNLLDFIIQRTKTKRPIKKFQTNTKINTIKLNKGKRRENHIKKSYSRLKKIILRNRLAKLSLIKAPTVELEIVDETIENFEKLELNDEAKNCISKSKLHSRKFRPYCDNLTSSNLCKLTEKILQELFRFQKRAYDKNEIKARAHKRYVVGFKETIMQLNIDKLKFIVIAPDCELCDLPGGIDETINNIKIKCKEKNVQYLFSLRRRQLGYVLYKKVPVNCIGVISYDGAQDIYHQLIKTLDEDKNNYKKRNLET